MRLAPRQKIGWLVVALAVAVVAIPGLAQDRASSLVMSGDPPTFVLMYTGDVIGFIEPCG